MKILFVIILKISLIFCKVRYDNYTLYEVVPQNKDQVELLKSLENHDGIDLWNEPTVGGGFVDILVSPEQKDNFDQLLGGLRSSCKVMTNNVQRLIDDERVTTYNSTFEMTFDAYYTLEDIYQWLDDLVSANPGIVTKIIGGTTYEGREIQGIKISHGPGRKAIFLEGGLHAREWISMATVNFITNELLYSSEEETRTAARHYDWYIFPVTNPDGYVYSHNVNRMWRKNTRPVSNENGSGVGVDLNRNWDAYWMFAGTSDVPTNITFGGYGPFSEIETRTLSEYISSIAHDIEMYLAFHNFAQFLLLPYGHTTEHLDNYDDVVIIGRNAMEALAVRYGTEYTTGNIAEVIYPASGGSVDWVKLTHQVPIVLCYELRDRGQFGFLLPAEQIRPTGEETMDSVLALIREGKLLGYF